ncbi:SBP-like protein [Tanacetum coccineum]
MITLSTLASTHPQIQSPKHHSIPLRRTPPIQSCNLTTQTTKLGLFSFGKRNLQFVTKSTSNGEDVKDEAETQARGESTMPERFRYLTKEAPHPPVRWPYFVALAFLVYAWRTVLWELHNWKRAATSVLQFLGYIGKLVLALIYHFLGDPITSTIRAIETTLYAIRAFYSQIVAYTPIPELSTIILLTSAILAISEVASPNSVDDQWHLLTVSGLTGYLAVKGMIGDLVFWTLLFGLFSFSRFIKKRDYVSSALPVAAVLVGVGEPWVRVVMVVCFAALAVVQYSKTQPEEVRGEVLTTTTEGRRVPIPLLCAALAIGVRVAAKWAGYRHLTWMVSWCNNGTSFIDLFPGLFALESFKDCRITDGWHMVNGRGCGNWAWRIQPRGRALDDVVALISIIGNLSLSPTSIDKWKWAFDSSGHFKVKTLTKYIQNALFSNDALGKTYIWNSWIPPKTNICVWRASLDRLPTRSNLSAWGALVASITCLELVEPELTNCLTSFSISDIALGSVCNIGCSRLNKIVHGVFQCSLWAIWKWRNKLVNAKPGETSSVRDEDIFSSMQRISKSWISVCFPRRGFLG